MKNRLSLYFLLLLSFHVNAQIPDTVIKSVKIVFTYSTAIFPESWQPSPIDAFGEQMSNTEVERSGIVIGKALDKYPENMLSYTLKSVYFLKQMKFYDVSYGGTNSTDAVYLTNQGILFGYTDNYIEQTFHHEFSSILFRDYPAFLDTTAWKEACIPGFIYNDPENGVGAIRSNQSSQEIDTLLCDRGILTQYGGSSLENDVNTFAQNLFCPGENFWTSVDRFPRIKEKTKLLISFYHKISHVFTEQYFRSLKNQ